MTNITIRAFEMNDWQDVAELFLAPKCRWGTLQLPYQSRDAIKDKLQNPPPNMHRLVAVDNKLDKVIGMIGLHPQQGRRAHAGHIGMMVHDSYQDQGVGSKLMEAILDLAEKWLNLKRIELIVHTDNQRAIHLYKKYGFVLEGTFRNYAYREGSYIDAHAMAKVTE